MTPFVSVAVPVPALDLLTYLVPDGTPAPVVGARVVVPIGSRQVTGIVVAHTRVAPADVPASGLRPITRVLDDRPFVPSDVVELASWTATYYAAGAGETITAVLPPKTRGERADSHRTRRLTAITTAGLAVIEPGDATATAVTPKQREALQVLSGVPDGLRTPDLSARGVTAAVLSRLLKLGLVSVRREIVERDPFEASRFAAPPVDAARRLTGEQMTALDRLTALADARAFKVALLHGVTGSGDRKSTRLNSSH